jgi:hypothetical protein
VLGGLVPRHGLAFPFLNVFPEPVDTPIPDPG